MSFYQLMWIIAGCLGAGCAFIGAPVLLKWLIRDRNRGIWLDDSYKNRR